MCCNKTGCIVFSPKYADEIFLKDPFSCSVSEDIIDSDRLSLSTALILPRIAMIFVSYAFPIYQIHRTGFSG